MARELGGLNGRNVTPRRGITNRGEAILDTIKEGSCTITKNGPRIVRTALVSGLAGAPEARTYSATQVAGVPRYGDTHPFVFGLPVESVEATMFPNENTIAEVRIVYAFPIDTEGNWFINDPESLRPQIEFTSTVQAATTMFDVGGNQIVVTHTPDPPADDPAAIMEPVDQSGEVDFQLPMSRFIFRRRENILLGDLHEKNKRFVGTVNSIPIFGEGAGTERTWMCVRIHGVSDDAGETYNVTYEFQKREQLAPTQEGDDLPQDQGWDAVVVWRDPATGLPVSNPAPGVGIKRMNLYRTTDFNDLQLTI